MLGCLLSLKRRIKDEANGESKKIIEKVTRNEAWAYEKPQQNPSKKDIVK